MSMHDYVMRGWDSVGGAYVTWLSPGYPDFAGNFYTAGSPTFASLTDVAVARRVHAGSGCDPGDWVRTPGVIGPAAGTPFIAADYSDIDDKDGAGQALLVAPSIRGGRLVTSHPVGAAATAHTGVVLAEPASGDWVAAARISVRYQGQRVGGAANWFAGLTFFPAQNAGILTAAGFSAGYGRNAGVVGTSGTCGLQVSASGRGAFAYDNFSAPALDMDHTFDVFIKTSGALVYTATGGNGGYTTLANKSYTAGDGTLAMTGYAIDTTVSGFFMELVAYAPPGVLADFPGL